MTIYGSYYVGRETMARVAEADEKYRLTSSPEREREREREREVVVCVEKEVGVAQDAPPS